MTGGGVAEWGGERRPERERWHMYTWHLEHATGGSLRGCPCPARPREQECAEEFLPEMCFPSIIS